MMQSEAKPAHGIFFILHASIIPKKSIQLEVKPWAGSADTIIIYFHLLPGAHRDSCDFRGKDSIFSLENKSVSVFSIRLSYKHHSPPDTFQKNNYSPVNLYKCFHKKRKSKRISSKYNVFRLCCELMHRSNSILWSVSSNKRCSGKLHTEHKSERVFDILSA